MQKSTEASSALRSAALDPGIPAEFEKRLVTALLQLLDAMFDDADDTLFGMAETASDNRNQALHFDTMRVLRSERPRILDTFKQRLRDSLRLNSSPASEVASLRPSVTAEAEDIELQDMDTLEKSIAISNMTAHALQLCGNQFSDLTRRLEWLREHTRDQLNPAAASPGNVCEQFQASMDVAELDIETQLLVYKLFELVAVTRFRKVYKDLDAYLETRGVLKPSPSLPRQPSSAAGPAYVATADRSVAGHADTRASGSGGDAPLGARYGRIITALNMLQHRVAHIGDEALLHENWVGAQLRGALQAAQTADQNRKLPANQTRLFELLSTLFEDLLTDARLSDPVKILLARLQIPIVKIAMVNPDFFRSHAHPARELLSEIARLGKHIGNAQSATFTQVKKVVETLLQDFDQDLRQIECTVLALRQINIVASHSDIDSHDAKRRALNERATNQAKDAVMRELSFLARGKVLPDEIKQLVVQAWGPVMGLQFAKYGSDSAQWRSSTHLLAQVVQSVQPEQAGEPTQDEFLANLRNELVAQGVDETLIGESLARLEAFHRSLNTPAAAQAAEGPALQQRLRALLDDILQPDAWFQIRTRTGATGSQWLKFCAQDHADSELKFADHRGALALSKSLPDFAQELCTARVRPIFTSDQAFHKLQAELNFALHPSHREAARH